MRFRFLLLAGCSCASAPTPLPSEQAAAAAATPPPLPRLLYDAPPDGADPTQQRVRLLLWIRAMELDAGQLDRLEALRRLAITQRDRVAQASAAEAARRHAAEDPIYAELWARLSAGAPADDPALLAVAARLEEAGTEEARRKLLIARMEAIRRVLEAQQDFLSTLRPAQAARLLDALFLLRSRLDPLGTPGDFEALVGSTWEAGQTGILLRGTSVGAGNRLDPGGLWSAAEGSGGDAWPEARREALLYLALLEPALEEAILAARQSAQPSPSP